MGPAVRILVFILLLASNLQAVAPGTIGLYKFASGSRLLDSSGNGNDLTSNGTPVYSDTTGVCAYTGAVGPSTAVNFVSVGAILNGRTTYTIEGYAYDADHDVFEMFFGALTGGATSFGLYKDGTNVRWYDETADTIVCSVATCFSVNTCHSFAVTSDGAFTYVYIDNVLKLTRPLFTFPDRGISFGVRAGNSDGPFDGYVSGVRISTVAHSSFPTLDLSSESDCIPAGLPCD